MNNFISQINRIKTMMMVNEDFQNEPSVAVIGDQIAYLLDNSDLLQLKSKKKIKRKRDLFFKIVDLLVRVFLIE